MDDARAIDEEKGTSERERERERWRMRSWVNEGGWARGRRGWIRVNESPDGRMKEAGYEEEGRIERR